jgi:AraC family transcriptional regulator, regulatory protein of adaptative response / methylated-DNA-[protein]-cysteine methyltransferase
MTEEEMWMAVLSREPAHDLSFVYGVNSTMVYCRPTCPSRRPNRTNVVFFSTSNAAKRGGYRPCRRCRPEGAGIIASHVEAVGRAIGYAKHNLDRKLTLEQMSREAGLSPFHLQRVFKRVTGMTPHDYVEALRVGRLKSSLREGEPVRNSIYGAGYRSTSWLYADSRAKLGMLPSEYRSGGEGRQIRYAVVACSLGKVIVAGTGYGVCFVGLGGSEAALVSSLRREYPTASLSKARKRELGEPVRAILNHLAGGNAELGALPIDVQATAFQWKVWKRLQSIPYGETRSYSQVAEELSMPGGARAVAKACASTRWHSSFPATEWSARTEARGAIAGG